MRENEHDTEAQTEELPRVCKTTHHSGAIYVASVETEAGVVTVRAGLDIKDDEVIVGEREGEVTDEVLEAVADHFDAETAREGGVGV